MGFNLEQLEQEYEEIQRAKRINSLDPLVLQYLLELPDPVQIDRVENDKFIQTELQQELLRLHLIQQGMPVDILDDDMLERISTITHGMDIQKLNRAQAVGVQREERKQLINDIFTGQSLESLF